MRLVHLLLLNLLFGNLAHAGNPEGPVEKKSILFLNKQKPVGFAADRLAPDTGFYNRNNQLYQIEQKIHSGRAITLTGVGLFAGGALITAGAVGFSNAIANINNNNNFYGYGYGSNKNTAGLTTGAVMCYIIGPASIIGGIPLIAIGAIKWSEGSFEKRMYMSLQGTAGPDGMGMKMTF